MANKIITTYWSHYDSVNARTEIRCFIECDSPVDLPPNVDAISGYRLTIGTIAHTIDGDNTYMMASNGTWYVIRDDNSYYTIAQVNALLAQKQDLLTFDPAPTPGSTNPAESGGIYDAIAIAVAAATAAAFGPGQQLLVNGSPPDTDNHYNLDALRLPGFYNTGTAGPVSYIDGRPVDTDITSVRADILVLGFYGGRSLHIWIPNRTNNAQAFAEFYIRSYGTSWSAWRGIYGTQI